MKKTVSLLLVITAFSFIQPLRAQEKAVKESLKNLVKGAKDINKLVKENATDDVLKSRLSALHDVFHQVMEKCEKEDHIKIFIK